MTNPKTDTKAVDTKVDTYRVTAPYVTLKSRSDSGALVVLGYFEGAIVPDSVDLEDLARHIRKGMVTRVEGEELKTVRQQQDAAARAAQAAAAPVDKEGAEAVKDAEASVKAAEDDEARADAEAKKTRTARVKASDSPRSSTTAATG